MGVTDDGLEVTVEFLPTGERHVLEADVLVHATGYRSQDVGTLLGESAKICLRDDGDALRVGRDHRVEVVPEVRAGIYVQGGTEHTHGLSSTLLSTTAVRAGEILASLAARQEEVAAGPRPAPETRRGGRRTTGAASHRPTPATAGSMGAEVLRHRAVEQCGPAACDADRSPGFRRGCGTRTTLRPGTTGPAHGAPDTGEWSPWLQALRGSWMPAAPTAITQGI